MTPEVQMTDRLEEIKTWVRVGTNAELTARGRNDLAWLIGEVDWLRASDAALCELAFQQEWLIHTLEHNRLTADRVRAQVEEAREALRRIPIYREGECENGCRRLASHVLVVEREGATRRRRLCLECGQAAQRAHGVDSVPRLTVHLEAAAWGGEAGRTGGSAPPPEGSA